MNEPYEYHPVAPAGSIPAGTGKCFAVAGLLIAVFFRKDEYLAINDLCPHQGAPLSDGYLEDDDGVVCPWHAWKFRITDGCWLDNPRSSIQAVCYPVRVENGQILVGVPVKPPITAEPHEVQTT